jgi:hypothetical protein
VLSISGVLITGATVQGRFGVYLQSDRDFYCKVLNGFFSMIGVMMTSAAIG